MWWSSLWQEYRKELTEPPLIGPGLRTNLPPRLRQALHVAFTTLRYVSFYLFFKPMAWLTLTAVCNLHVRGRENIPGPGEGGIGTPNHLSNFDPVITALLAPRPVFVMVKTEYFKTPLLGGATIVMGGFPVRRGEADRQAVKTALTLVKRRVLLGIFPEGTRSKTFKLQPAQPGAAMLASANDAMVWPVSIAGTENIMRRRKWGFLRRPRVEAVIGKAYNLKEEAVAFGQAHNLEINDRKGRPDLDFLSDIMMLKIAENLPPEYRGDFTVEGVIARQKARLEQRSTTRSSAV